MMAPGYKQFKVFCVEAGMVDPDIDLIALPGGIISDDEDDANEVEQMQTRSSIWKRAWRPPMPP
jgi:hypothetical protein